MNAGRKANMRGEAVVALAKAGGVGRQRNTRAGRAAGLTAGLAALWLWGLPSVAPGQFTWVTNDGAITITGYSGPAGPVNIPSNITGLPVVAIGANAFMGNSGVTAATIPDTVTFDWIPGVLGLSEHD